MLENKFTTHLKMALVNFEKGKKSQTHQIIEVPKIIPNQDCYKQNSKTSKIRTVQIWLISASFDFSILIAGWLCSI